MCFESREKSTIKPPILIKKHKCSACDSVFSSKEVLKGHIAIAHNGMAESKVSYVKEQSNSKDTEHTARSQKSSRIDTFEETIVKKEFDQEFESSEVLEPEEEYDENDYENEVVNEDVEENMYDDCDNLEQEEYSENYYDESDPLNTYDSVVQERKSIPYSVQNK